MVGSEAPARRPSCSLSGQLVDPLGLACIIVTSGILFLAMAAHSTDAEHPFHGILSSHSTRS